MNRIIFTLGLVAALAGAAYAAKVHFASSGTPKGNYRTAKIEQGEVIEGVQANGNVQPITLVTVGTQISGVLVKLGPDPDSMTGLVDFNSVVKKGELLAEIDPSRYKAQVQQDQASVAHAKADLVRVQALLFQAERDLARDVTLNAKQLLGQADLDAAVANRDSLKAQIDLSKASIVQAQSQLDQDLVNLGYCTITSPIDGVVVSRAIDIGQTVAASFNTPTLFSIANDLTKVQVQASVPEADIGRIHKGQTASFTVDAFPDKKFTGVVSQVRLASTTVQNVVTYTILVDAKNPADADHPLGLLLPGMTATVTFEVASSPPDALHVPASALRLDPPEELIVNAPAAEPAAGPGGKGPKGGAPGAEHKKKKVAPTFIFVPTEDGRLRAIRVKAGISDGVVTAIETRKEGELQAGMDVVTAVLKDEEEQTTNPFAMRFGGGKKKGGGH